MTPRMLEALDAFRRRFDQTGVAPTLDELAAELGLASKSGAHKVVEQLLTVGAIERTPGRNRALRLAHQIDVRLATTAALRAELARREGAAA